jgi:polysaccharide chain length determinant protein (PEP-CTERM system associated)
MLSRQAKESGFELRAIWSRRKWLALASMALPLSVAITAAASLPDLFRSTALVVVEHEEPPGGVVRQSAAHEVEARLQTLNQENLSRSRLQKLITSYDLYRDFRRRAPLEEAIDRLRRDIQVEVRDVEHTWGRATVAFTLSYRGRDPQTVAQVTNTLASFYVEQSQKRREWRATGAVQLLKSEIDELKKRLDQEEQQVTDFKLKHLRELPEQVKVNLANMERLNAGLALNRESQKRIEERTLGQRLAGGEASTLPDDPELRLARLRADLRDLRTRVTEHHPDAIRLKAEIASLSGQAGSAPAPKREAVRGSSLDPSASPRTDEESPRSRPELRALEREETSLKQAVAEYEQLVYNAPKREQELQKLLLPYETTKALYHSLLARLEDAQLAEGLEDQQANDPFRLVDPAVAATRPAAPDRLRIIFEGVIVALGLAVAAVLLAENREPSFHSLQDLRSLVRSPVLVSIPRIVTPGDVARRRLRACLAATLMAFTLAASMGGTYAVARGNEPMVWMLALHDH